MSRTYRIAMVAACPFPVSHGSQVLIGQLSEALSRRGHHLHLVCYHFGEAHGPVGYTIHRIPKLLRYSRVEAGPTLQKPFLDVLLAAKLLQVVKSEGIEIIHAHNYEAPLAGYIVRCLTGTPVVFHSHNTMGDELWTYFRRTLFRRLAKPIARVLDSSIPKRADFCIALCKEVGSFLVRMGVPEDRVLILPPGIDHPAPVSESISALRERHGLGEAPLVIYTGNLDNYQNIDLLLEGFVRVVRALPESVLLVVSNYDPAPYAAMAKEMGLSDRVLFRKFVSFEEVWRLLAMSDVAVNTRTSWSGFPIKTLNYMAAGKAIVAFDGSAKGMEHLVNGYIVPNNEVGEFADGVVRLIKDAGLRKRLGENARRTAREKHSWVSLVEEMEKVYERLLA